MTIIMNMIIDLCFTKILDKIFLKYYLFNKFYIFNFKKKNL